MFIFATTLSKVCGILRLRTPYFKGRSGLPMKMLFWSEKHHMMMQMMVTLEIRQIWDVIFVQELLLEYPPGSPKFGSNEVNPLILGKWFLLADNF